MLQFTLMHTIVKLIKIRPIIFFSRQCRIVKEMMRDHVETPLIRLVYPEETQPSGQLQAWSCHEH